MPSKKGHLSQVFLKDRDLVGSLIKRSSIDPRDTVLEVGPGEGMITRELVKRASKVIAVEKDPRMYQALSGLVRDSNNLELYQDDALSFPLPKGPYKVFANIPFAIEGKLIRRFIEAQNPPQDAYLVMRREVAERMAGVPKEGQFSILYKPFFDFEIFHRFKRGDFKPKPKVESVMFRIRKKEKPLIKQEEARLFKLLVKQGFGGGRRIRQNLSLAFSSKQLKQLAQENSFQPNDKPSDLTLNQWLAIFDFFRHRVPEDQRKRFTTKVCRRIVV